MGKSPLMNMENFPCDVWRLHRKLFHRFLKYKKYFVKASKSLPELQQSKAQIKQPVAAASKSGPTTTTSKSAHVISLLTSSEEEVSDDSDTDEDPEDVEDLFQDTEDDDPDST